jgi:hypothetical protein
MKFEQWQIKSAQEQITRLVQKHTAKLMRKFAPQDETEEDTGQTSLVKKYEVDD